MSEAPIFRSVLKMAKQNNGIEFFAGLVIGYLVGAALAILFASKKNEDMQP